MDDLEKLTQYLIGDKPKKQKYTIFKHKKGIPHYKGSKIKHEKVFVGHHVFQIASLAPTRDPEPPVGMELWKSSKVMSEYILLNSPKEKLSLLELGCGVGLTAIAATVAGYQVTATDKEPDLIEFAKYNAQLNEIEVHEFRKMDWQYPLKKQFDVVIGADVTYADIIYADPKYAEVSEKEGKSILVIDCIKKTLAQDGVAMIVEPVRSKSSGKTFLEVAEKSGMKVKITKDRPTETITFEITHQ